MKTWYLSPFLVVLLLVLLLLAPASILLQPLTNFAFADNLTTPTRALPPGVLCPNTSFNVTVNWTINGTGVNSLYLIDYAPAGWGVSGNNSWNTPVSNTTNATGNKIEILWSQNASNGTAFSAKYQVTVPGNATPGNYTFTNGTVSYYVNITPYTQNISGASTVTVQTANLTINSTAGGNVTVPGEGVFGPYCIGTVVNLTATPDANYHFVNWTGNVSTIANVSAASTTITMNGTYSITANFAIDTYNLTINSTDGGNVTDPGEGVQGPYDYGTVVNLTATADGGYHFVNWTGDTGTIADPNAASTTITINGAYSITANFAINTYNLTINSTDGGNVTDPGEGVFGPYDHGTVVNLTAAPDAYWDFVNWTGDTGTIADPNAASTTITMNGEYSITANFALLTRNLTTDSTAGGNVTVPGEGTFGPYINGTVVNITAIPDASYTFVNWTGDVSTIGNVNSSFTNIIMYGDYSIVANFAPCPAVSRDLLPKVVRGQTFNVTVNWTSPVDNFNAIGFTDLVPAGLNVAVDGSWCTPAADENKTYPNGTIEYGWTNTTYSSGTPFTALYQVTVPWNATAGNYTFPYDNCSQSWLEFFVDGNGPYKACTVGDNVAEVVEGEIAGLVYQVAGQTSPDLSTLALMKANVTLWNGTGVLVDWVLSNPDGSYNITVPTTGNYTLNASLTNFTTETSSWVFTTAEELEAGGTKDFMGNASLVPALPQGCSLSYTLGAINLWLFHPTPPRETRCALDAWKASDVVNVWLLT